MPDHVGHRLHRDRVRRHLDVRGQLDRVELRADGDGQPVRAVTQSAAGLLQRADQAQLVERWRSQRVHQRPQVADDAPRLSFELAQHSDRARRVGGDQVLGGAQPLAQAGQRGSQAVVQIPMEAPALLLPDAHRAVPGTPQVCGQAGRAHGRARLGRHLAEQVEVSLREPFPGTRCNPQPADLATLERHREPAQLRAGRCAVLGRARSVGELEADKREPQRGTDRVDDGLRDLVAGHGRGQSLPELGHDRTGVISRAVDPTVDALLDPEPDGTEDHRGQSRRDHRQDAAPVTPDQPDPTHHCDVHGDDEEDQRAVDQTAAEPDVDIDQPVPQHRHGYGNWDERDDRRAGQGHQEAGDQSGFGRLVLQVAQRGGDQDHGEDEPEAERRHDALGLLPLHRPGHPSVPVDLSAHARDEQEEYDDRVGELDGLGVTRPRGQQR